MPEPPQAPPHPNRPNGWSTKDMAKLLDFFINLTDESDLDACNAIMDEMVTTLRECYKA